LTLQRSSPPQSFVSEPGLVRAVAATAATKVSRRASVRTTATYCKFRVERVSLSSEPGAL
jgi:hypothetical protein